VTAPHVDAVFAALADPTRRQLLDQISRQGPLTATELAGGYPISRQAVVKHLSALAGAGLLEGERQGRDVRYRVVSNGFGDATTWLVEVGQRWDIRLAALQRHLDPDSRIQSSPPGTAHGA
jgi:DNA-binding transcriptional ArsR family regulator